MPKSKDYIELEKALIQIKRDKTDTIALNTVLSSKHADSIVTVGIILKERFLKLLLADPDVYNAPKADRAFKLFKYFSPMDAEIFEDKKDEKDKYWSMKKDYVLLQHTFKLTMKGLVIYIVLRLIYESIRF